MIPIEKDIPLPKAGWSRKQKNPWNLLEVGDSFLSRSASNPSGGSGSQKMRKQGWSFVSRKQPEGGWRVWRTK